MFINLSKTPAIAALCIGISINAQSQISHPVTWIEKPVIHKIDDKFKKQSAAIILDQRRLEYKQDAKKELYVYRTIHRIISVLDDKGVESFNKFTIPTGRERTISDIKARTILPNGKVINIAQSAIKTTKNENENEQYLFAMDGVEKGAEIEVVYTERKPFSVFGLETFQSAIPVLKADFSLIVPENLVFDFVGYNGFPKVVDSIIDSKHFYHAASLNIEGLEEEEYSNEDANRQRVDFKMSYVKSDGTAVRRFTWNELAKDLYDKYETFTSKESKIARKYLETLGVEAGDDELKKIQKIEDGMKAGISISENIPDETYEAFDKIVDKKLTTEKGFARFMAACFAEAGIVHEFGLTSSRYNHIVDEELELWSTLGEFLFYLPKQKMYLAPTAIIYRAPYFPFGLANNKGIFCKITKIGDMVSAVADIRVIKPLTMEQSQLGVEAQVTFDGNLSPQVVLIHNYYGLGAIGMRPAFLLVDKDKEKELLAELSGLKAKEEDIIDYKIEHKSYKGYYSGKALKTTTTFKAPQLMEKAGPKYLFAIGNIIGPQQEMYKDEERKQPIDVNYCHSLPRTINITIPEGYKITNPDVLKINVTDRNSEGEETMGFVSGYSINGNVLQVNINEFYNQLNYPVSAYPVFRKVINAAADFNKVILVFQKI